MPIHAPSCPPPPPRRARPPFVRTAVWAGLLLASSGLWAQGLKTSGFASLVVGKTSGPCQPHVLAPRFQDSCTRQAVDWAHGGVVTDQWAADVETRAGLQLDWKMSPQWTATTQITARTLKDQSLKLEWAYLTYAITPEWSVRVGRKRIPLYYYSDFQDVGFAYNTVRPSADVYGWDVVNYNGVSLSTRQNLGAWTLRAEAYAGGETSRKNHYNLLFSDTPLDVKWSDLAGASAEASYDWFTVRLSYTRSNYELSDHATGEKLVLYNGLTKAKQDFLGLALNGDWDRWQLRSEFGKSHRMDGAGYDSRYHLVTVSWQIGDFTLTGGTSQYAYWSDFFSSVKTGTRSVALRYDVHKGGALKLQFDRVRDRSEVPLAGSARSVTVAYDVVF